MSLLLERWDWAAVVERRVFCIIASRIAIEFKRMNVRPVLLAHDCSVLSDNAKVDVSLFFLPRGPHLYCRTHHIYNRTKCKQRKKRSLADGF